MFLSLYQKMSMNNKRFFFFTISPETIMEELYLLSFPIVYLLIYLGYDTVPLLNIPIVAFSYYLIFFKRKFYPIIFLALFSRCINGFVMSGNGAIYSVFNFITGYLPIAIYVLVNKHKLTWRSLYQTFTQKYWITSIYLLLIIAYSFINPAESVQMLFPRLVPMFMFVMATLVLPYDLEWRQVIKFFRYSCFVALFSFVFMDYMDRSGTLLETGVVFSKPMEVYTITMFDLPRNMGIFWDFRILGIFSTIYLFIVLAQRPYMLKWFDAVLACMSLLSTISRGSMVLAAIIVLGLILQQGKGKIVAVILIMLIIGGSSALCLSSYSDEITRLVNTFNVFSGDDNALSQREGFRTYAMGEFYDNPLGSGVGSLKAAGPSRNIPVGNTTYNQASDAFLAIQLAEIGFFGFVLFICSLFEILLFRSRLGLMVIFGLLVQMSGTDTPDMGVFYFMTLVILVVLIPKTIYHINTNHIGALGEQ